MATKRLYLLYPLEQYLPGVAGWADTVSEILLEDPDWSGWDLFRGTYDARNSFHVQPLFARVLNTPGPVVLVEGVQRKAMEELRSRLRTRAVVLIGCVGDETDLLGVLEEARRRFDTGEPFLPRKFAVAVLIVRKLKKGNYWAGKEKGYLWRDDLARGRGVDERYADIAHVVVNDLLQHDIMIFKTSQGKKKYALNPARKPEIHAIADNGEFWNSHLKDILMRDVDEVPALILNDPRDAECFAIAADGQAPFKCAGIAEAISHAKTCAECPKYLVEIGFAGNHILQEIVKEKHILIQFLEGFQ